jgi:hypothetical protein
MISWMRASTIWSSLLRTNTSCAWEISFIPEQDKLLSQDKHLPEPVVKDRKNYQLLSLERKDH